MNSQSSAIRGQVLAITVLVLAAYACGTIGGGLPGVSHTPYPESAAIQQETTGGSGPFVLEDPKTGLADLPSYTATLTLSFDGSKDGKAQQWTKTYVMLARLDPRERKLTVQKSGDLTNLDNVNLAERDGVAYTWQGENTCVANAIKQGESPSEGAEPASLLSFVVGADEAGTETVNGVASNHYTFDEHALALQGVTQATGELWTASDGGYVVKYVLTSKGKSDYFGEGIEGTLTEDYELSGVGAPVDIQLPADCPPGLVDAPRLADASDVVSDLGLLTYATASTTKAAAAFYQKQLPKLGWKATGIPSVDDTSASLQFEKDGETILVNITADNDTTKVQVALLRTQE